MAVGTRAKCHGYWWSVDGQGASLLLLADTLYTFWKIIALQNNNEYIANESDLSFIQDAVKVILNESHSGIAILLGINIFAFF